MKNKNLMSRVIMLFAFLSLTSFGFAQISTEEDMAKAVFETIKNNDLATFSSYCINEERMAKMLNEMGQTTPQEKGIKQELQKEGAEGFRSYAIKQFGKLISELESNNIPLKDIVLSELKIKKSVFEVTNLKAIESNFDLTFNEISYKVYFNTFKNETDLCVYDFGFYKIEEE